MKNRKPFNQYFWWIILNPTAGNGSAARRRGAIEKQLKKCGFEYELVETKSKEHAFRLVVEGIEKGHRHIMGIGGDGTNNEIINGILQQKIIAPQDIIYTLIPLGTGNDWIKQHRIPSNWKKWITKIAGGKVISHNAGLLHFHKDGQAAQRYFINVAGMAYDAFVTKQKEEVAPAFFPAIFYLWQVLICMFQYQLRKATVKFDDHSVTDHFYTINIGICKYSGGGMQFVPHADPTTEHLALTLAGPVSKITVLTHIPHIFLGKLHKHPKVNIYKTKQVQIAAAESTQTMLEADGEFLGETPVSCVLLEKALRVLVP